MPPRPAVPELSVVIVNWNAGGHLAACLRSLERNPPSVPWEAIVVDNASRDASVERARQTAPAARFIVNERNRGLAAANNQGMLASGAPYLLMSNPDVELQPGAADALLDLLRRRPRAAFAFARLVHPDGSPQTCAGDLPRLADALLGRQSRRRRRRDGRPGGFWWDGWDHDEECLVGHGLEACYLARRAAVAEIGLQDERFPLDWEGIDWAARADAAGWQSWFCPRAVVVHHAGASIRQAEPAWVMRSHRGIYRYFAKRSSLAARPFLAAVFALRASIKLGAVLAGGRMYDRAHRPAKGSRRRPTSGE